MSQYDENYFSKKYEKDAQHKNPIKFKLLEKLLLEYSQNKENLLEIGCGYGSFLASISHIQNSEKLGIDIAKDAIDKCSEFYSNITWKQLDIAEEDNFNKGIKYSAVLAIDVLEHIPDVQKALLNIAKNMKQNGVLVSEIPLFSGSFWSKILWKLIFGKDETHVQKNNLETWNNYFQNSGFENLFSGTIFEYPFFNKISSSNIGLGYTGQWVSVWKKIT